MKAQLITLFVVLVAVAAMLAPVASAGSRIP